MVCSHNVLKFKVRFDWQWQSFCWCPCWCSLMNKFLVFLPQKFFFTINGSVTIRFAICLLFFLAKNILIVLENSNNVIFLETKHTYKTQTFFLNFKKKSLYRSCLANSSGHTIIKINDYLRGSLDGFWQHRWTKFQQVQMKVPTTEQRSKPL